MRRLITFFFSLLLLTTLWGQDGFSVQDYSTSNKHKRAIVLTNSVVINAISIAKTTGMSVEDFATKMGDNWAKTWDKDGGFKSLVNGTIWNNSTFLNEDQPKVEILEQSDRMVKLKLQKFWKGFFQNGAIYDVTEAEYITFWEIASERIAEYMGCSQTTKLEEDYLIITISAS